MAGKQVRFPFAPKSNAHLESGMFWPVSFGDGRYAAGVVLGVPQPGDPHQPSTSRLLVAGLLDWQGLVPPTEQDLANARLIDWGSAHVKSINLTSDGTGIVGIARTAFNALAKVSHRAGGTVHVYVNGVLDRVATSEEARDLEPLGAWGLTYIARRAEHLLQG